MRILVDFKGFCNINVLTDFPKTESFGTVEK